MKTKAKKQVKKSNKKNFGSKTPKVAKVVQPLTFHHVVILDKSGSMQSVRESTINGFNENAVNIRNLAAKDPNQKHSVTLVIFSDENKNVYWRQDIGSLKDLTPDDYVPDGWTALCDAMGRTMFRLNDELNAEASEGPVGVLVTIITDGHENRSTQYDAASISKMIEGFKGNKKVIWTITYLGANQDVMEAAKKYNIAGSNVASYTSDSAGTKSAFRNLSNARGAYVQSFACSAQVGAESLQKSAMNFFSADDKPADFTQQANQQNTVNQPQNTVNPVNPPSNPNNKTT